jgi:hypothetical protein
VPLRGVRVGTVSDFAPEHFNRVRVGIAVSPETQIHEGARASLTLRGLSGLNKSASVPDPPRRSRSAPARPFPVLHCRSSASLAMPKSSPSGRRSCSRNSGVASRRLSTPSCGRTPLTEADQRPNTNPCSRRRSTPRWRPAPPSPGSSGSAVASTTSCGRRTSSCVGSPTIFTERAAAWSNPPARFASSRHGSCSRARRRSVSHEPPGGRRPTPVAPFGKRRSSPRCSFRAAAARRRRVTTRSPCGARAFRALRRARRSPWPRSR